MPITLDGTNGITTPMYSGAISANAVTPSVNMKSRIINGAMVISQRGTSFTVDNDTIYSLDRWMVIDQTSGVFTAAQSSDAPTGFVNSLLATVTTADASIGATELALIRQRIEGFNGADLGWGTANAKTITLSFWVKSSLTGTFGGSILNGDASRSYPYTYTINSANTWEQKSITITGDTTGTWATTNTTFAQVDWSLAVGSTYSGTAGAWASSLYLGVTGQVQVMSTLNATLQLTGVQFEVGSTATSFDYRPIGTELDLCQRYCFGFGGASSGGTSCVIGLAFSGNQSVSAVQFPVQMRGYPSLTVATPSNFYTNNIGANTNSSAISANTTSSTTGEFLATLVSSALTTGQAIRFFGNNSSLAIWSAEL